MPVPCATASPAELHRADLSLVEVGGPEVVGALDERELVEQARTDPNAFAELYRRHLHRIHAYAYRRSGSQEIAEDVTAATFERALRYLDSFQWRPGGFAPWLYRIAANELADHYRGEYRGRSDRAQAAIRALHAPLSLEDEEIERVTERLDDPVGEVLEAMGRLNPRYQRALSLRFLSDLSLEEAAAAMECSKSAMSVIVHRALAALRKSMRQRSRSGAVPW